MVASPNTANNDTQSVAVVFLTDEKKSRHNGTTFVILTKLGTQEGTHWVYSVGSSSEDRNTSPYLVYNDGAGSSVLPSVNLDLHSQSVSTVLSKVVLKREAISTGTLEQSFTIDHKNVQAVTLANSLFSNSGPLVGLEAKVLRGTIRRNARSSSILPNRF